MGNKIAAQSLVRERAKPLWTKTTGFHSRFLRKREDVTSGLTLSHDKKPKFMKTIVVPKGERVMKALTLDTTIKFLKAARDRGYQITKSFRELQRSKRQQFLLKSECSELAYDEFNPKVRQEFYNLILMQCEDLSIALDKGTDDMLIKNGITEEILEKALNQFGSDPTLKNLVEKMQEYEPLKLPKISHDRVYEIMMWRSETMEKLEEILEIPDENQKEKIVKTIMDDETFAKYKIEEEELLCAFAKIPIKERIKSIKVEPEPESANVTQMNSSAYKLTQSGKLEDSFTFGQPQKSQRFAEIELKETISNEIVYEKEPWNLEMSLKFTTQQMIYQICGILIFTAGFVYIPNTETFTYLVRFPVLGCMYGFMTITMINLMVAKIEGTSYSIIAQVLHALFAIFIFPMIIYSVARSLGVIPLFSITLSMLIIVLILTTTVEPEFHRNITKKLCMFMILALPAWQLSFSIFFGTSFAHMNGPEEETILYCFLYPVGLMLFKAPMLHIDLKNFQQRIMFELISLIFADIPYKTYFFVLENVWSMYILLTIKFVYKFTKFLIGMLASETIQKLRDKRENRIHIDNTYYVIGYADAQLRETLVKDTAIRFYFQQFNDSLTTLAMVVLLAVNIFIPVPFFIEVGQDQSVLLILVFLSEILLEIMFSSFATFFIRLKFKKFSPLLYGSKTMQKIRVFYFWLVCLAYPLVSTILNFCVLMIYA